MLRDTFKNNKVGMNPDFKYRGENQTRIETLSDGVFALAIALLVLSSSVPERFDQLLVSLEDLIPFAICITLLMLVWYEHYLYSFRFGLQNAKTVALNTLLLFLILFYVYPLKFLFKVLYKLFYVIFTGDQEVATELFTVTLKRGDGPHLMIIYGLGVAAIFFVLVLMYIYALKMKNELELSDKEIFDTKTSMYNNFLMGAIPLISVLIAFLKIGGSGVAFSLSGMSYMLYAIAMPVYHIRRKKIRRKVFKT